MLQYCKIDREHSCSQADFLVGSMVEPLLHFVVPFVSLRAVGVDLRKATFASLIALTPDLDVAFNTHRSPTHSAVVLGLVLLASSLVDGMVKSHASPGAISLGVLQPRRVGRGSSHRSS